jgi:SAM-dependent methyltransferase
MGAEDEFTRSNRASWDLTAQKYAAESEADIEFLRHGGISLMQAEIRVLGDLSGCNRAVHLQCSHGLDTLSLLNLGVSSVVGVDFSEKMLALARLKSAALQAHAKWIQADVLELPETLGGSADLVFTGKGALPWVQDLDRWASGIAWVLAPGGRLFLLEGHPLNWLWKKASNTHQLDPESGGYFDTSARANLDFPASAVRHYSNPGEAQPVARERQWNLGQVVTAVSRSGLIVERLEECPEHYWPQFRRIEAAEMQRVPHSFLLLARAPN